MFTVTSIVEWLKWKSVSDRSFTLCGLSILMLSLRRFLKILTFSSPILLFMLTKMKKGVGAPLYIKRGRPHCPIKVCYKYTKALPCPKSTYSSTHKCEESSSRRKAWRCVKGASHNKYVLQSGETVELCPCRYKIARAPVLSPISEYKPKCS